VFIGSRWCPRHVVLALGHTEPDGIAVYEPSSGSVLTVSRAQLAGLAPLEVAGWTDVWFVVSPGDRSATGLTTT
jgi:hypothetical protein